MLQSIAGKILIGVCAIAVGAIAGWAMVDLLPEKTSPTTARTSSAIIQVSGTKDEEAATPARRSAVAPDPAAARPPAPARAAEAPKAPAPAASPPSADDTPSKPRVRIDKDRREVNIDTDGASFYANADGKLRIKARDTSVSIDPDAGRVRVRAPYANFSVNW
jgi:type IV secretory pathway VirB10-like protein